MLAACGGGNSSTPEPNVIRPLPTAITLVAGAAESGSADDPGSAARFANPAGIAVEADGNLYVADHGNHTIRKITPAGEVAKLAGASGSASEEVDGQDAAARFSFLVGLAIDNGSNLFKVWFPLPRWSGRMPCRRGSS